MSDNAGGGRRGLRAKPSPELFAALYQHYGIRAGNNVVDLGGSSSLNPRIDDSIVRVYRPYVTEARLASIHHVRRELAHHGVPCQQAVATRDGRPYMVFDGRLVEVERHVQHDGKMDSWEHLKTALPLLGKIHSILHRVEVNEDGRHPLFANHIEPTDTIDKTLRGTQRIRAWNPTPQEQQIADSADELARQVSEAERAYLPKLPRQLVHGDFWDNNALFAGDQVVLVADLDFMGERARIDDLALTLYFTILDLAWPDVDLTKLRELVDAYNSGLDEPLTSMERAALPLAIARQPLWGIGGWVAQLDDEQSARRHAAALGPEIELGLRIMQGMEWWQAEFA